MKALIVGAGIGGLSAAIALRRAGLEVEVYERASELRAAGAGIGLWPNAIHALKQLGVADRLLERFPPIERTEVRTHTGSLLAATEARIYERRFGEPFIGVHRADLQAALADAVGRDAIRMGAPCVAFAATEGGITARFEDGTEVVGDLLVGADGIHSAVRTQLHPASRPRYWGATSWRGVVSAGSDVFPLAMTRAYLGPGAEFGILRLDAERVYWYLTLSAPEGGRDPAGAQRAAVLARLSGWDATVARLVEATDDAAILRSDLYDLDPLPSWGHGPVTLLGDAAHAQTPHLGQGGAQAIEDAVVLGRCLADGADPRRGLRAYEAHRRPRTERMQALARRMGTLLKGESAPMRVVRNAIMRLMPASLQLAQLSWVLGYRA